MKNFKFLSYLLIAASSLVFMQCTSDYTAINGTDGENGLDGIDGIDGVGVQVCTDCHANEHRDPINVAYAMSRHSTGSSWGRGTSASCAQCHNNEGYIDYLSGFYYELDTSGDPNEYIENSVNIGPDDIIDNNGTPENIYDDFAVNDNGTPSDPSDDIITPLYLLNPDYNDNYGNIPEDEAGNKIYIQSANPAGYVSSNPINCSGCHTDHRSFDFETDGNDYALRNIDPVKLVIDPTVSIDLANANEPLGLSNACVTCHQPRPSYPVPAGTDDIEITSSRYGPHHGPQSTMFEGIMGANIAGSVAYPGIGANGDSAHRKGTSCVGCHMGEGNDDANGDHSWGYEGSGELRKFVAVQNCIECHSSMTSIPTEITAWSDFKVLRDLLEAKGFISSSGSVVRGTYPVKDAQAIWNYKTLEEDQSNGMHNPKYTEALLKNTLEYLQGN